MTHGACTTVDHKSKACSKCHTIKPFNQFHKNKTKSDGLESRCKTCVSDSKRDKYVQLKSKTKTKNKIQIRNTKVIGGLSQKSRDEIARELASVIKEFQWV